MKLELKRTTTLSAPERHQITQLAEEFENHQTIDYLDSYFEDPSYDIVLHKQGDQVLAFSVFRYKDIFVPFLNKELPLVQFSLTIKNKQSSHNVIWKSGDFYARQKMGKFYALKESIGTSLIINPKVFENFLKLYPANNINTGKFDTEDITQFLHNYYDDSCYEIKSSNCLSIKSLSQIDISEQWEKRFRAKEECINQLFIDKGLIQISGPKISKSDLNIMAFGYRNPKLWRSFSPNNSLKFSIEKLKRLNTLTNHI